MNMRKRFCSVLLLVAMSCLLLVGCGGDHRLDKEGKATLKKYSEWAKAIGLMAERRELEYFDEAENSLFVSVYVSCQELADFAERSMRFTEEHPDYFPEEMRLIIGRGTGRGTPSPAYSNKVFPRKWEERNAMVYLSEEMEEMLESYEDGSFRYLYMNLELWEDVGEPDFPVSVVFISYDEGLSIRSQETWNPDYLTKIQGLQCVVINLFSTRVTYINEEGHWDDYTVEDYTILRDRLEELLPGVSVYITEQEEILIGPSEND